MSLPTILLVAAIALGAGGHYFGNATMTTWGFAVAVGAGLAWLARAAWEQRSRSSDTAGQSFDEGPGGPHNVTHHDAPSTGGDGDGPGIGSDS